jgi:hypothetical protein
VVSSLVLPLDHEATENANRNGKIDPVLQEVRIAFRRVPFEFGRPDKSWHAYIHLSIQWAFPHKLVIERTWPVTVSSQRWTFRPLAVPSSVVRWLLAVGRWLLAVPLAVRRITPPPPVFSQCPQRTPSTHFNPCTNAYMTYTFSA